MPTKKTPRKRPTNKAARSHSSFLDNLIKTLLGITVLCLAVVGAATLMQRFLPFAILPPAEKRPPLEKKMPATASTTQSAPSIPAKKQRAIVPRFEVFPKEEVPPIAPSHPTPPLPRPNQSRIAIIVDDIGYDNHLLQKFLNLNAPITLSVLPFSPLQDKVALSAELHHKEIMLHLPMEPMEYPDIKPGPGALLTSMSPDQLIRQLEADLNAVPGIKGVNNHMGSRMTAISTQMYQIFSILKKRNLYFVDSRTTPQTLCKPSARLLQIRFAERDVFLDHTQDSSSIRHQINRLIQVAVKNGQAIGICHPHSITYQILQEKLPEIQSTATIVPVSELVSSNADSDRLAKRHPPIP